MIIAIQEHWLTPDKLYLLNEIHPYFCAFGVSATPKKLSSCIYRGRPYGGVAFMWHKSISKLVIVVGADEDSICLCINISFEPVIRLFSVYFLCSDSSVTYETEISNSVAFIRG